MEHYVITADRRHLRIHRTVQRQGSAQPGLALVQEMEFSDTRDGPTGRETDQAGRFADSRGGRGQVLGGSIDERLPMKNEMDKRVTTRIAENITELLADEPQNVWSFAAGPDLHRAVLESVPSDIRGRLRKDLDKNLTSTPTAELAGHFFG